MEWPALQWSKIIVCCYFSINWRGIFNYLSRAPRTWGSWSCVHMRKSKQVSKGWVWHDWLEEEGSVTRIVSMHGLMGRKNSVRCDDYTPVLCVLLCILSDAIQIPMYWLIFVKSLLIPYPGSELPFHFPCVQTAPSRRGSYRRGKLYQSSFTKYKAIFCCTRSC